MIEAFEIGVSLALQDGVSDAIGKARRDVAALEHAVRESGVSVQSLRDAGVKVSSVSFGDRRSPMVEEPPKPVAPDAAPRVAKEVEQAPFVALLGPIQTEQPGVGTQDALAPTVEPVARETNVAALQPAIAAPPSAIAALQPAFAAPVASIPSAGDSLSVANFFVGDADAGAVGGAHEGAVQASAPLAVLALADRPEGAPAGGEGGVAPVVPMRETEAERPLPLGVLALPAQPGAPLLPQENDAPAFPPSPLPVALPDQRSQPADGHVSLLSALRLSGGSIADPQDEAPQVAQRGVAPGSDDDVRDEQVQQAPAVTALAYGAAPDRNAVTSGSPAELAPPQQAEAAAAGPREGDVFLDGMLVGRWMSRFLNREAERASAGPTGFDARRGRLLPGVTVGG